MFSSDKDRNDKVAYVLFWSLVAAGALAFAAEAVGDIASRKPGEVTAFRAPFLALHAMVALPILVIAPLQFNPWIRKAKPAVHRWLGRTFLTLALIGSASALVLGATIEFTGSRVPLILFGLIWAGVSAAAWICARRGDFVAHRAFVMRSFAVGFAFVWVRLLRVVQEPVFGFIEDTEMRGLTREWLSFVVPLLIVEIWLSWGPALRNALKRPPRKPAPASAGE